MTLFFKLDAVKYEMGDVWQDLEQQDYVKYTILKLDRPSRKSASPKHTRKWPNKMDARSNYATHKRKCPFTLFTLERLTHDPKITVLPKSTITPKQQKLVTNKQHEKTNKLIQIKTILKVNCT